MAHKISHTTFTERLHQSVHFTQLDPAKVIGPPTPFAAMHFITDITKLGLILCGVSLFSGYEGKPVTRRAISEMQLMHNYGDFRHTLQRQEWLQMKLQNLHPASVSTPQESTPKVAETRPQKPHKKEGKSVENRIRHGSHQNPRTVGKKGHRHSAKPSVDGVFKPDFQ